MINNIFGRDENENDKNKKQVLKTRDNNKKAVTDKVLSKDKIKCLENENSNLRNQINMLKAKEEEEQELSNRHEFKQRSQILADEHNLQKKQKTEHNNTNNGANDINNNNNNDTIELKNDIIQKIEVSGSSSIEEEKGFVDGCYNFNLIYHINRLSPNSNEW